MKLAITNKEEIQELRALLNEMSEFYKYERHLYREDLSDFDFKEGQYDILRKIKDQSDLMLADFTVNIFKSVYETGHSRILWNLDALLDNCADKTLDHLDFNPKIKAAFRALEFIQKNQSLIIGFVSHEVANELNEIIKSIPEESNENEGEKK